MKNKNVKKPISPWVGFTFSVVGFLIAIFSANALKESPVQLAISLLGTICCLAGLGLTMLNSVQQRKTNRKIFNPDMEEEKKNEGEIIFKYECPLCGSCLDSKSAQILMSTNKGIEAICFDCIERVTEYVQNNGGYVPFEEHGYALVSEEE